MARYHYDPSFAMKVCELLDIDPNNVTKVVITMENGSLPIATVTRIMEDETLTGFIPLIKEYVVIKREVPPRPAEPLPKDQV